MKSFVRWVGGKTKFVRKHLDMFPRTYGTYFEPFVGAGSVLLALKPSRAVISDINYELITTWQVVQCNVEALIASLTDMTERYGEDYFYEVRGWDVTQLSPLDIASRFIFLNKTCFNGIYRVNRKGQFNVSFDRTRTKPPLICDAKNLREVSQFLNKSKVTILCQPYDWILKKTHRNDLVYIDAPYLKDDKRAFTSYSPGKFGWDDHVKLKAFCERLKKKNVKVVMSNAYGEAAMSLVPEGWDSKVIEINSSVSCQRNSRGAVKELLITSF